MLCVGTGGLGSPLLLYLAAAGVGRIGIVDFDVVDESAREIALNDKGAHDVSDFVDIGTKGRIVAGDAALAGGHGGGADTVRGRLD